MITKVKVAVALTQEEIDYINTIMEKWQTSFSGALRMIIEDFISQEKQRNIVNKGFKK
jgi:VIT1/CCC1 family predicted Fe2+/Mn2+ transporter